MSISTLINEVEADVIDVVNTDFDHIQTNVVPNRSDSQLTFERGKAKKGKLLKTCVLFVDIRNSVSLTEKHQTKTMGRIYTAFTKAVLKAAKHHQGHIRNIIGDRVMIVFPAKDCFTNAVDCGITINHIAQNVINKQFKNVDFKCGIGIDYGDLRVIKVGIQRQGHEGTENRGLVWVGYPANIASRLTDVANKTITETYFKVVRNPINPKALRPILSRYALIGAKSTYDPNAPFYLSTEETVEMSVEKFANEIASVRNGELFMKGGKFIRFSKEERSITYPGILMTSSVYNGLKSANPKRKDILNNYWKLQEHAIKNVSDSIYGAGLTWIIK